ncbi:hypothetical protein ABZ876_25490 [Streptomyces sp. NPDC046931]|uniref:hypothetical protein n=1 Tax=Streptomyces sp. NPDC046931 TaxID=3154806 RepID=UPI0033D1E40B
MGEAIEKYSHEYRRPRGVFLSIDQPDDKDKAFAAAQPAPSGPRRRLRRVRRRP